MTTTAPASWPHGYVPLWHRCTAGEKKARGKGTAYVNGPDKALDYFTREPLGQDNTTPIDPTGMIKLLVRPGTYQLVFKTRLNGAGDSHAEQVEVVDPLAVAFQEPFRDGKPLWRRPGKYDQFIINENPYRKLPIQGKVLDCGAHIGTFARDALHRGADQVTSYEPEPFNFGLLTRNTTGFPVECRRAAISGEAADGLELSLSWTESGMGSGGNSLFKSQSQRPVVSVPVHSFVTALWELKPGAVKMDIKGGELMVDWSTLTWPDETVGFALEADVEWMVNTLDPILSRSGFTPRHMPKLNGWKRTVAIWAR